MADVFLSYRRTDNEAAQRIARSLSDAGVGVWYDTNLLPGDVFADRIRDQIAEAGAFVLIVSAESMRSGWVTDELNLARSLAKPIIPVLLERTALPASLRALQTQDLSNWRGDSEDAEWRRLVKRVRGAMGERRGVAENANVSRTVLRDFVDTALKFDLKLPARELLTDMRKELLRGVGAEHVYAMSVRSRRGNDLMVRYTLAEDIFRALYRGKADAKSKVEAALKALDLVCWLNPSKPPVVLNALNTELEERFPAYFSQDPLSPGYPRGLEVDLRGTSLDRRRAHALRNILRMPDATPALIRGFFNA